MGLKKKHDHFDIIAIANGVSANHRYSTNLGVDLGWTGGDRVAYKGAYAFLLDQSVPVARVTFSRVEYAEIDDRYMAEGQRHYDGTIYTGSKKQLGECPPALEAYVPHIGSFVTPVIDISRIYNPGLEEQILDTRDFNEVVQHGSASSLFAYSIVGEPTSTHIAIVAYQLQGDTQEDEPVFAIYYDTLDAFTYLDVVA